jgi:hypothetical protein
MTEGEAETKRQKAIEFLERIGGDAGKFRDMDAAEYAAHKGAELLPNPFKRSIKMTKSEMAETLDQLADGLDEALDPALTREELVSRVKNLADIAAGEEDEDEDDANGGDEDNGGGDDQD